MAKEKERQQYDTRNSNAAGVYSKDNFVLPIQETLHLQYGAEDFFSQPPAFSFLLLVGLLLSFSFIFFLSSLFCNTR